MESLHVSLERLWSSSDLTQGIRIFDSSVVQYWSETGQGGIIRTEKPIPKRKENFYFEIAILGPLDCACCIDIGLTSKDSGNFKEVAQQWSESKFTGLQNLSNTFGYSSDGTIYGENTVPKCIGNWVYSGGDVIGCYVDNVNGICSFTKNGEAVKKILHITNMEQLLFPTIALGSRGIMVNTKFREMKLVKFEFDLEGMIYPYQGITFYHRFIFTLLIFNLIYYKSKKICQPYMVVNSP